MAEKKEAPAPIKPKKLHYLSKQEANELQQELLNEYKFSQTQLAQLGGLSAATAVFRMYPPIAFKEALILCGSSMIGSYGLIAAIHMIEFGYNVTLHYVKQSPEQYYLDILSNCIKFGVGVMKTLPTTDKWMHNFKVVVDALHGNEDEQVLESLIHANVPVCSIDAPSGWDIEKGPKSDVSLKPAMLISIGVPKKCALPELLGGAHHFLGGRFLSRDMIIKRELVIPNYPYDEQIVDMWCFAPCCKISRGKK